MTNLHGAGEGMEKGNWGMAGHSIKVTPFRSTMAKQSFRLKLVVRQLALRDPMLVFDVGGETLMVKSEMEVPALHR
jgi:hypothetical protein